MTREQAWEAYVAHYNMEVPEAKVENEMNLIRANLRHRMQYDMLTGAADHLFPDLELEQQQDEIRAMAVYEVKSELVMKALLAQLDLTVTREELEAEAAAMAKRQNTTLDMIKGFFGEDLAMLGRDVKEQKAKDWVLSRM